MRYWTWKEIREKVEGEQDLQEEPDILGAGELMGYVNDAIDMCEAHFIQLGDYFLAEHTITLVPGTRDYDLPEDIYATKLRLVTYNEEYEMKPARDLRSTIGVTDGTYRYILINNRDTGPKIRIFPTPKVAGPVYIYYTRNANRLTVEGGENQVVDIPEAMLFINAYLEMRIQKKERSPLYQATKEEIAYFQQLLENALADRISDGNNEIIPDTGSWDDHV